jgi:uncharacterized protein YkwD
MRPKPTPRVGVVVSGALLITLLAICFLTLSTSEVPSHAMPIRGEGSPLAPRSTSTSTEERAAVLYQINRARVAHHLRRLRLRASISDSARRQSLRMMRAGSLFHTADLVHLLLSTTTATRWGENVGEGGSIAGIRRAWMGSPLHRHNILDRRFSRGGIGVVYGGGHYWITLDLYG